ncbi:hypothetical protein NPIL_427601 [Nephila pilipes]|uniref:Uncharacterized protein n=1 Tax=Nephila pilipes TaxID=299642 RepID=A0A8X6NMB5_NEPPI|nr:hypothetical protein NPIL_427601 [Nephila pilipes]
MEASRRAFNSRAAYTVKAIREKRVLRLQAEGPFKEKKGGITPPPFNSPDYNSIQRLTSFILRPLDWAVTGPPGVNIF